MKQVTLFVAALCTTWAIGQEVKTSNDKVSFSHGSFDAIVVTIPYGNKDVIEKELEIAREVLRTEGKPEDKIEMIAYRFNAVNQSGIFFNRSCSWPS